MQIVIFCFTEYIVLVMQSYLSGITLDILNNNH